LPQLAYAAVMDYAKALAKLRELADEAGLGIKTFCLVFLDCETVPEAVAKVQRSNS
jgi:hypothetical protein